MPFPKPYTKENITSGFRPANRTDHTGIDMSKGKGTVIYPIWAGKVIETNQDSYGSGYGNYLKIKHSNGLYSLYAHLDTKRVQVGKEVDTNTPIGTEGNTGYSFGSHLHFEIQDANGQPIDPTPYLLASVQSSPSPNNQNSLFGSFFNLTPQQLMTGIAVVFGFLFLAYLFTSKSKTQSV